MKTTLVILKVNDDRDQRDWWVALGLPNPDRWSLEETFGKDVLPYILVEEELVK